jgi:dipeptidase
MDEKDYSLRALDDFKVTCRDHRKEFVDRLESVRKETREDLKSLEQELKGLLEKQEDSMQAWLNNFNSQLCEEKAKNSKNSLTTNIVVAAVSGLIVTLISLIIHMVT